MNRYNGLKVVIVGGGSGGHLTPLLAIARALKVKDPHLRVNVIGQRNENLQVLVDDQTIDGSYEISAGKFRRYHGESLIDHLRDFRTIALNFRDVFRMTAGVFQSWRLLGKLRPDVIMLKGGFVCVPVGIAARLRRIPYITHDSDAVPGLANRITARHAVYNTTAMAPELYPYVRSKTLQVGVPLRNEFSGVSSQQQSSYKKELGIRPHDRVLFCTGGGLGAQKLNSLLASLSGEILVKYSDLQIIHLSGKKLFEETRNLYHSVLSEELYNRVRILDFSVEMHQLSGAADVIITRAGATSLAEFAAQKKACIVVPNPVLTGGQQLHNADLLLRENAAIVVNEDDRAELRDAIEKLLKSGQTRQEYGAKLNTVLAAGGDAADHLAHILLSIAQGKASVAGEL